MDTPIELLDSETVADQREALHAIVAADAVVTGHAARIVQLAGSRDDNVRMYAAQALEAKVVATCDEIETLAGLLDDGEDGETCYWAATMIGRVGSARDIGDRIDGVIDALQQCIGDSMYLPAREQATWAVAQIGPPAQAAVPTLRETAQTAPPRLQQMARQALEVIGDPN